MKSFVTPLCLCLILNVEKLFVKGQCAEEDSWSWVKLQDRAHWPAEHGKIVQGNPHNYHYYTTVYPNENLETHDTDSFHHTEHETSPYEEHTIINANRKNNPRDWWKNHKNIEPLANLFKEEENGNENEKYNKEIFFKVDDVMYPPTKSQEPHTEVIVDDVFEEHHGENYVPVKNAAIFGEFINNPSSLPFKKSKIFDTFAVEKSQIIVEPEENGGQTQEILVEKVEVAVPDDKEEETGLNDDEDHIHDHTDLQDDKEYDDDKDDESRVQNYTDLPGDKDHDDDNENQSRDQNHKDLHVDRDYDDEVQDHTDLPGDKDHEDPNENEDRVQDDKYLQDDKDIHDDEGLVEDHKYIQDDQDQDDDKENKGGVQDHKDDDSLVKDHTYIQGDRNQDDDKDDERRVQDNTNLEDRKDHEDKKHDEDNKNEKKKYTNPVKQTLQHKNSKLVAELTTNNQEVTRNETKSSTSSLTPAEEPQEEKPETINDENEEDVFEPSM